MSKKKYEKFFPSIEKQKEHSIPEWFSILKTYKHYSLEKISDFSKTIGAKVCFSKKEFKNLLKLYKNRYAHFIDDEEMETMLFIDEHSNNYSSDLLDFKIQLLEKIYDRENTRQNIADDKAQTNLNHTSIIIALFSLLGTGDIIETIKTNNLIVSIITIAILSLTFVFFVISLILTTKAINPVGYIRPRQDLMKFGIESDIQEQKKAYFEQLYISISENQKVNSKKNDYLRKANSFFLHGMSLLAISVIIFLILEICGYQSDNHNIIYFIIEKTKYIMPPFGNKCV